MRWALLGLLVLLLPTAAVAQRKAERNRKGQIKGITVNNLPAYDSRWFHPGLYVALSASRYFIEQSDYYVQQRTIAANSIISPTFGAGVIADARLGDYKSPFILRFAPGVTFSSRQVEFKPLAGYPHPDSILTQEVVSTTIQFPLMLKYQSDRRRNTRLYMIAGINPIMTVGSRRDDGKRNVLRQTDSDLAIEYGFGFDFFYPLFKFAPELRFSHGLRNVLVPHNDVFSRSLQSLTTNSVTLYINIQN
jgi:hypothetical protein